MMHEKIKLNGKVYSAENLGQLQQLPNTQYRWFKSIVEFLEQWFDKSDFIATATSGSTGKPKQILLSKKAMRHSASMTNQFFGLNEHSTALLCLPAEFIAGKMMLVRAMIGNFNLICVEPTSNPFVEELCKIDFCAITPHQLSKSLKQIEQQQIGHIIVGGSPLSSTCRNFVQHISSRVYETYGMTETCSHIALRAVNGPERSDYFRVLDQVTIRVNEQNCLCITAPELFDGELTTNDIVSMHLPDSFIWQGRLDHVINSGGIKIHPEKIEHKLSKIIHSPFFVSSLPDASLGQKLILVIESTSVDTDTLKMELSRILNAYELPKAIFLVEKFSYSASNKLLKNETLALIENK